MKGADSADTPDANSIHCVWVKSLFVTLQFDGTKNLGFCLSC